MAAVLVVEIPLNGNGQTTVAWYGLLVGLERIRCCGAVWGGQEGCESVTEYRKLRCAMETGGCYLYI